MRCGSIHRPTRPRSGTKRSNCGSTFRPFDERAIIPRSLFSMEVILKNGMLGRTRRPIAWVPRFPVYPRFWITKANSSWAPNSLIDPFYPWVCIMGESYKQFNIRNVRTWSEWSRCTKAEESVCFPCSSECGEDRFAGDCNHRQLQRQFGLRAAFTGNTLPDRPPDFRYSVLSPSMLPRNSSMSLSTYHYLLTKRSWHAAKGGGMTRTS